MKKEDLCKKCGAGHDLKKGCAPKDNLKKEGSITLKPHPKDVIDVDKKIIDGMKSTLKEASKVKDDPREKVKDIHDDSVHTKVKKATSYNEKFALEKAKVDEGKTPREKAGVRADRNDRKIVSETSKNPKHKEMAFRLTNGQRHGSKDMKVHGAQKESKGINQQYHSMTPSISEAGSDVRIKDNIAAKENHAQTLKEMKTMKKPSLVKTEMKPGMSLNDLYKAEQDLVLAEQEANELAKSARRALEIIRSQMKK